MAISAAPDLPFDLDPEFGRLLERCAAMTMTSVERMYALYGAVRYLIDNHIAGDLVECGVWRGGSAMMMALAALAAGDTGRDIRLYDTFSGMTAPTDADIQTMSGRSAQSVLAENQPDAANPFWGIAPRALVATNMASTAYPPERIHLIEGDVADTLPARAPRSIALLRLDTDWYTSTRHELETLYKLLSPGGVLIIDDYGYWAGARRAVDEFFATLDHRPLLMRIDFTGRMAIKP